MFAPPDCEKCHSYGKMRVIPSLTPCYLVTKEGN